MSKEKEMKFDNDTGEITDYFDELGRELPSPIPVAPPVGYKRQPSMVELVRRMVMSERLKLEAAEQGMESFEESEDFDIGDDYDPTSPYENEFDPPISELREAVESARREKEGGGAGGTPPAVAGGVQAASGPPSEVPLSGQK